MALIKITDKVREKEKKSFWDDPVVKDIMESPETTEEGAFDSRRDEDAMRGGPLHGMVFPHKPNYMKTDRTFPDVIDGQKVYWLYRKSGQRGHRMRRLYRFDPCPETAAHPKFQGAWPYDVIEKSRHLGVDAKVGRFLPDLGSGKIKPTWSKKYD